MDSGTPSSRPAPPFTYSPTPLYRDPSFAVALLPGLALYPVVVYVLIPLAGWLA